MGERTEREVRQSAYEAYLVARSTGRRPVRRTGGDEPLHLLEYYAIALGVHHYFAGVEPVSAARVEQLAEECAPRLDEDPPEDETAGVDSGAIQAVRDLVAFLQEFFPGEVNCLSPEKGDRAVDVAVRLLGELREARRLAQHAVTMQVVAARMAREHERTAVVAFLKRYKTRDTEVLAEDPIGPSPPDPGAAGPPAPPDFTPRVLPGPVGVLRNRAEEAGIRTEYWNGSLTQDVHLSDVDDPGALNLLARPLTPKGAAWVAAFSTPAPQPPSGTVIHKVEIQVDGSRGAADVARQVAEFLSSRPKPP